MMMGSHLLFVRRTTLGVALVGAALLVPAIAQTQADLDQSIHAQRQPRTEMRSEEEGGTSAYSPAQNRPRITAEIEAQPQAQLTSEEKQALSQAAARLLSHVDKARQALASENPEEARAQIKKGLTLARIIERSVPSSQVRATITAGDMVYQDQDTVKMTTIPIYMELGEVSVLAPVQAAKREALRSQMKPVSVVQDVELQHTTVTLDSAMAKQHLKAAKSALREESFQMADQALAAIQTSGVSFTYAEMDLPLIRARKNLTLARSLVKEQQPEAARVALQEAGQALSVYGKKVDESQAAQVQSLRQQITELSQNLETHQDNAAEQISHLWDQVTQLAG